MRYFFKSPREGALESTRHYSNDSFLDNKYNILRSPKYYAILQYKLNYCFFLDLFSCEVLVTCEVKHCSILLHICLTFKTCLHRK